MILIFLFLMSVVCGEEHSLILDENGCVRAFGGNNYGQLGIPAHPNQTCSVPLVIPMLEKVNIVEMDCGDYHCACIDNIGSIWMFGDNSKGQLGLGDKFCRRNPSIIPKFNNIVSVGCGIRSTIIITEDGRAYTFGENNRLELPIHNPEIYVPTIIPNVYNITSVAIGASHTLLLTTDGRLYVSGDNLMNQLGLEDITQTSPIIHPKFENILQICAMTNTSMVLDSSRKLYTFGSNQMGNLGCGSNRTSKVPVEVKPKNDNDDMIKRISCGYRHGLVLYESDELWSFGDNWYGQSGTGVQSCEFTPKKILDNVEVISSGGHLHNCKNIICSILIW